MTQDRFHSKDVHINEDLDFFSLVSNPALLRGLIDAGYQRPSPIQLKTIPLGRLGLDLVAQAKSGTGKTIVFSVIAIESVISATATTSTTGNTSSPNLVLPTTIHPLAVIIAPTREIAVQIEQVIHSLLSQGLQHTVTCHSMIGGLPIQKDKENLKKCSIVVGTPGRVKSLIDTGHLRTDQVRLLVLDEADKLMEDVFKSDVYAIAKGLGPNKQVMAFSATYDDDLLAQIDVLVKNPMYVMLSNGTPELEGVLQYFKVATLDEKHKTSSVFLRQTQMMEAKFIELEGLFTHVSFYQAIVFLNHRGKAADLVKFLSQRGWPAMHIASGLTQEERLAVMTKARKFELRVLVCSDLIARGIDIERVNLVVNLDLPKDPETYLHRIGRTGRFGTTGLAVSIVDNAELKTVQVLQEDFDITIRPLLEDDKNFSGLNMDLKNRHHERPLQVQADQEQFQKLQEAREKGKAAVVDGDKDENKTDESYSTMEAEKLKEHCVLSEPEHLPERTERAKQRPKKKQKLILEEPVLPTPTLTASSPESVILDKESEGNQVQDEPSAPWVPHAEDPYDAAVHNGPFPWWGQTIYSPYTFYPQPSYPPWGYYHYPAQTIYYLTDPNSSMILPPDLPLFPQAPFPF